VHRSQIPRVQTAQNRLALTYHLNGSAFSGFIPGNGASSDLAGETPISQLVPYRPTCRLGGFTLPELTIVVGITLILAAVAIPTVTTAVRNAHIRGSASEYANLLQTTRTRAITDDRFYAVYVQPGTSANPPIAYADVYPMGLNGSSGLGPPPTGHYNPGPPSDPMTILSSEVIVQPVASVPAVAALNAAFCVSCTPDLILNAAPTWGPDGMPCKSKTSLGGTELVCNSSGGPVAYVTYFQSTVSQQWSAVTMTPGGRVKAWYYVGNSGGWLPQ
jgi:type II secretory pathway pseudopilin PulG